MNRKGFTLVELLAALAILGIIVTIGGVAISKTISNTKEKNYETLIANIKSAVEAYYQECNYGRTENIECPNIDQWGEYTVKIGDLLKYGYINANKGNTIVNPRNGEDFTDCSIEYFWEDNEEEHIHRLVLYTLYDDTDGKCPHENDFED